MSRCKIGILKEIINQCYDRYYHAIFSAGNENTPLEERVKMLIRNLVSFYRENMKIAIVAFNVIPVDIPEIIDLRIKWLEGNREATERWYKFLGLDVANPVLMSIIHSYLTSIIFNFFDD